MTTAPNREIFLTQRLIVSRIFIGDTSDKMGRRRPQQGGRLSDYDTYAFSAASAASTSRSTSSTKLGSTVSLR